MGARITVRSSRAARFGRFCGALSVPVFVLTALGNRFSIIPESALLALISSGTVLALVACAFGAYALSDIWKSGDLGAGSAILAIVYSVPGVVLFAVSVYALAVYPRLNDVTTDLDNPPRFLSIADISGNLGETTPDQRRLQLEAYPEITSRLYPVGMERVIEAVRVLATEKGWTILKQDVPENLIRSARDPVLSGDRANIALEPSGEAGALDAPENVPEPVFEPQTAVFQLVARTYIFQFANYVVIRIGRTPEGTRVDLRSASTVGQHDLGQNARRVRSMLVALDMALQGERSELQPATR